jgi:hypothetical protein
MTNGPQLLAARRQLLIARAALHRAELEAELAAIGQRIGVAETAFALVARIKRAPLLTTAVAATVIAVIVSPRRALKWISYAATGYSLARRLQGLRHPER